MNVKPTIKNRIELALVSLIVACSVFIIGYNSIIYDSADNWMIFTEKMEIAGTNNDE